MLEERSGLRELDVVLQGLRLGDNVVWQVDDLDDYRFFVSPFVEQAIATGKKCVYLRFAPHPPVLEPRPGLSIVEVDPGQGFDAFSREVNRNIGAMGPETYYILDNLSALVVEWATDELLANFFQVTCPYMFEMEDVTYFALTRGKHAHQTIARIRDTTQVLIDVFQVEGRMYIHPLKVWDRYSPQMFLPHLVSGHEWAPLFSSSEAAAVSTGARGFRAPEGSGFIAPWDSVYARLNQHRGEAGDPGSALPEVVALKGELCHMIIGQHPQFSAMADRYFTVDDLLEIRDRMVGSGRIGGKAAGMLLARKILSSNEQAGEVDFNQVLEEHDSFYVGSDVFFTFLVENDLFKLRMQLTSDSALTHEEFAEVEERFLEGVFPASIMEQFRVMLDYFGQAPIIARSSSLLEDGFGNAFAGKYRSEYCANQGDPEERMESFLRALKLVYASALNPYALSYRRKRGLGDSDEQMAILIQRVSGTPYRQYFFPSLAGVAFSRNLYAWSNRIDPEQGIIRLVFGLGTRAVDRVEGDYPRMIAVSNPELRPEMGDKIIKYSQKNVDLLDLELNELVTMAFFKILQGTDYPNLYLLVSESQGDYLSDPVGSVVDRPPRDLTLTFNNLIRKTDFVRLMGTMLSEVERGYGRPVDIEFTASINPNGALRINLLQCRPLLFPGSTGPVSMPRDLPADRVLFQSNMMINGGVIPDVRYILYIDPRTYNADGDMEIKRSVGRVVGQLNELARVKEGKVIMMGPGRWGSSNIDLGVNVGYGDIDNASVLVEIAREEAGQVPEVSYGTHFFHDLVEARIIFLPLYPDDSRSHFNADFFDRAGNVLVELMPEAERFSGLVRMIDVEAATGGLRAQVFADSRAQRAICFLG